MHLLFHRLHIDLIPTTWLHDDYKDCSKTPLRYPGGKSRAVKKMAQFFPDFSDYTEFREPLLWWISCLVCISDESHLDIWINDYMNHFIISGKHFN